MSDAPERIAVWPDFVGHPSMTGQWSANTHPDNAVAYVRADLSDALLREAMEALADFAEAKFDALRTHRAAHPADEPDPVTDAETVWAYQDDARATLAKLRSHMGGNHE